MTVSHCWFNVEVFDCSINMQNISLGQNKREELGYDPSNPEFKELMKCISQGTTAKFDFKPDQDMIKKKIGKILKKSIHRVAK